MSFTFNNIHFQKFKECYAVGAPQQLEVGHKLNAYVQQALKKGLKINFPKTFCEANINRRLCRQKLLELCKTNTDPIFCFCAIMAWGGQSRFGWKFFDSAISDPKLKEKIKKLKEKKSAKEAFDYLKNDGRISGIGISFFTKLIFFFRRDGYILDQWTAKSAKLLTSDLSIKVCQSLPDPNTTSEQYEQFCKLVEMLAKKMDANWKPNHAEMGMFGGPKNRSEWRKYVISQWN